MSAPNDASQTAHSRLTKGLEEEVYTGTKKGRVVGLSHQIAAALSGFYTEPDARNVEYTTEPYRDYEALLARLMGKRCRLRRYLSDLGDYTLIPGATLPLEGADEFVIANPKNPYYVYIRDTYGTRVVTASTHINIGVEDADELVRAYRAVRGDAALFLALAAASPFYGGEVTGHHSTRWEMFPHTPTEVPFFTDHAAFIRWFEGALERHEMMNPRHLWLSVRPNGPDTPYTLSRLELRICDRISCPELLKAVTALLEATVWEVLENPGLDPLSRFDEPRLLDAVKRNEAEAAHASLDAPFWDWRHDEELPLRRALGRRLEELAEVAERHGLAAYLGPIADQVQGKNQAQRWLAEIDAGRSVEEVVVDSISEMAQQDVRAMGEDCR